MAARSLGFGQGTGIRALPPFDGPTDTWDRLADQAASASGFGKQLGAPVAGSSYFVRAAEPDENDDNSDGDDDDGYEDGDDGDDDDGDGDDDNDGDDDDAGDGDSGNDGDDRGGGNGGAGGEGEGDGDGGDDDLTGLSNSCSFFTTPLLEKRFSVPWKDGPRFRDFDLPFKRLQFLHVALARKSNSVRAPGS